MSLPDYIKTEWRSTSQFRLNFADQNFVESLNKRKRFEFSNIYKQKYKSGYIQCFISTLNIWEYKEESLKPLIPKRINNYWSHEETNLEFKSDLLYDPLLNYSNNSIDKIETADKLDQDVLYESEYDRDKPPGISCYDWELWKSFWHACLPRYIQLAWIHRFKCLTEEESIEWHDDYITSTPDIIPHLEFNLYAPLKIEQDIKLKFPEMTIKDISTIETKDISGKKVIDDLYKEFSEMREWAHFCIFLKQISHEPNEDLTFFLENIGIVDEIKFDVFKNSKINTSKADEAANSMTKPLNTSLGVVDLKNTGHLPSDECAENSFNRENRTENSLKPIGSVKNGYESHLTHDNSPYIYNYQSNSFDEFGKISKANSPKMKKNEDKPISKKNHQRKENRSSQGVAWAMRHFQNLNKQQSIDTADSIFKFGTEDVPPTTHFMSNQSIIPSNTENSLCHLNRLKRKRGSLSSKTSNEVFKHSKAESFLGFTFFGKVFGRLFKAFTALLRAPLILFSIHRYLYRFPFIGILPKFFKREVDSFQPKPQQSKYVEQEKKHMNRLKNLIQPLLKRFPDGSVIGDSILIEVKKDEDIRVSKEELCQVIKVVRGEGDDEKSQVTITYLTDEDCTYIISSLETSALLVPEPATADKEINSIRVHTIFDDDGNPQSVLKISIDDSKKRILDSDANLDQEIKESFPFDEPSDGVIIYDEDGNPFMAEAGNLTEDSVHNKIAKILNHTTLLQNSYDSGYGSPEDIPKEVLKYWHQRYRLFLKFDEGIKLDTESWYSVTPEILASHQADRCRCSVVIDAFCGAGGNAIQLATTCNQVIAIDIDPEKLALAHHNAKIYGVEDRIEFIQGDFFKLAPNLKADAIFMAPPWGGLDYNSSKFYDIFTLGGMMNGKELIKLACKITSNVALYLPRNSNIYQLIEFAGMLGGRIDIEFDHISNKRKSITAYFGDLVYYNLSSDEE